MAQLREDEELAIAMKASKNSKENMRKAERNRELKSEVRKVNWVGENKRKRKEREIEKLKHTIKEKNEELGNQTKNINSDVKLNAEQDRREELAGENERINGEIEETYRVIKELRIELNDLRNVEPSSERDREK